MELFFRSTLVIAGIINLVPGFLAFFPKNIKKSYGIELPNANYELLMRHRAILLGTVGGVLIYSALTKKLYDIATIIGFVSMISFMIFYWMIDGEYSPELRKVYLADVFASLVLFIGFTAFHMH